MAHLLEHLQKHAEGDSVGHARRLEHAGELADSAALDLGLGAELALDLLELDVDGIVVLWGAVNAAEGALGLFDLADAVVETGGLGEGQDANAEDDGPQPAETDDDAPRCGAVLLVRDGTVLRPRH